MTTRMFLRLACCLNSLQRLAAVRSRFRFVPLVGCVLGAVSAWRTGIMSMRVRLIGLDPEVALRQGSPDGALVAWIFDVVVVERMFAE